MARGGEGELWERGSIYMPVAALMGTKLNIITGRKKLR